MPTTSLSIIMFCKSCGKQIDDDSSYCSFCGTQQSSELRPQTIPNSDQSSSTTQIINNHETNSDNSPIIVRQPKYDPTYQKEDDAMAIGILLFIIPVLLTIITPVKFQNRESYGQFLAVATLVSLILRIFITAWVANIAKRQNRDTFGWGLSAFFLPSIALIVIATRKKLFEAVQIDDGLDGEQNSKILSRKAQQFYNERKYFDAIRFSEKAIELDPYNEMANVIIKKSKSAISGIDDFDASTQTVSRETKDGQNLKIVSKFYQTIGAEVFINELPALDGVYIYKSGTHKLVIENGKIKEHFFIIRYNKFYIEQVQEHIPTEGDSVFLLTGEPAPTGKYSLGLFSANVIVENGKFIQQ